MYSFSLSSFFVGVLILIAGVLITGYHQVLADNFSGGVGSYDKYKFWGLVICGVGFLVMTNLHTLILLWLVRRFFPPI